ncbi:hypothetical protein BJX99DRAFT_244514 [Aspergillus californicus]
MNNETRTISANGDRSIVATMNNWFVREILGMAISAGVFVALVVVLVEYDRKPQPSWGYMSLNSLISWMSTIARACIIISCSEALGQLKWVWFLQKPRPIHELRTFDSASRGTYGALELIWALRARHLAGLAGLAVVLALAIDPFAQNLVHYYPDLVDDHVQPALIGNTSTYILYGAQVTPIFPSVDPILKSNVYNSLFNTDPQKPWAIPQYSCPSANCTWAPAAALEARSLCANITNHLSYSCRVMDADEESTNCTVRLPSSNLTAWYVRSGDSLPFMKGFTVGGVAQSSEAVIYKNFTTTAIQYIAPRLSGNWWAVGVPSSETTWEATECTIEPIVRSFRASVHNNIYSDETLAVWNNYTDASIESGSEASGYAFRPPWGPELGVALPNQTFTYGLTSNVALSRFLDINLGGYFWRNGNLHQAFNPDDTSLYAAPDVLQALGLGQIVGCSDELATRLNCTMHNIAQAVSKSFRDARYSQDLGGNGTEVAIGQVQVNATYVFVQWQWLALPAFVWVITAATLAGTLWKIRSGRIPTWRNDPVPLLFLYSEGGSDHGERSGVGLHGSKELDNLEVRLYERTGRVVLGRE